MKDISSRWCGISLIVLGVIFGIFPQLMVEMSIGEARIVTSILWVGGLILYYLPNKNKE